MKHKLLAMGVLVILLIVGGSGLSASAANTSGAHSPGVPELPQVIPVWQQMNSNGFGDPDASEVSALATFKGYLYAGTHNPINPGPELDGARIFRSPDGINWAPVTDPGFGNGHDTAATAVLDMTVFKGYIYASTGRSANAAKIYRAADGTNWAPVVNSGFANPDNHDITALAEYGNKIYAGVTNAETGVEIWSSFTGDSGAGSWTLVPPTEPGPAPSNLTGFAVFDGALYGAVESEGPAQIWNTYGTDWAPVMNNGFGDNNTTLIGGMAVFANNLYVGAGNTADGARLYRSDDGATWYPVSILGLGDSGNQKVESVFVFQNQLYISVMNAAAGIKLWRSPDGTSWERANVDGFGDSNNSGTNMSNATANFQCNLYIGTSNVVDGGELWATQQQCMYIPLMMR